MTKATDEQLALLREKCNGNWYGTEKGEALNAVLDELEELRKQCEPKDINRFVYVCINSGVEGPHLEVGNSGGGYRLAGPKAWGGGKTIHKFTVPVKMLIEQAERHAMTAPRTARKATS